MPKESQVVSKQDALSAQYQEFDIDLTPHLLSQLMKDYELKASQLAGQYQFNQQRFADLQKTELIGNAAVMLPAVFEVITQWPAQLTWPLFNHQLKSLLVAWVEDYKAGASIDAGYLLLQCLVLNDKAADNSSVKFQFQQLLMHLFARASQQYDQYKFNYIRNFDIETGLPNQQLMFNQVNQRLHDEEEKNPLGMILVNLNINFDEASQLNAASSELMVAAIQMIQENMHDNATLFRVGPIELVIMVERLNFPAQLNLIAARLVHAFESALPLDNITLILKPFFGCVGTFKSTTNAIAIYDHARLALHHAMVNNYQIEIYDQHITASFSNRHQLDEAIIEALQQNELESYLQPIITLPEEACFNAEILLRWSSEQWKMVSAVRLIDTIYKKGFGKVFIRWLINTACQHVAELISTHQRSITLTLNLSVTDLLDSDLPELLAQSIALWEIPAENLIIEITEGDILVDEEKAARTIDKIVALGCKLALDDFGTGYSSMTRLRTMPIDFVKIDQSFVRNIASSPEDREIVQSVVNLAHSLGMQVVAEGVEDQACLDILKRMDCEKIQGYHYAQPMCFDEFSAWLMRYSEKRIESQPTY
jgi:EAL domain-containing protein (putative c-di-GMP-specific phosphodiesterase class I)/GGDEF domain-containing protein